MNRKKKGIGLVAGIAAVLVVILVFGSIPDVYTERSDAEMAVPEKVQSAGHGVETLENLSAYDYEQREIEVDNNGQRIYGIALTFGAEVEQEVTEIQLRCP